MRKALYKNGALKLTGTGFAAGSSIAINGQTVSLPISFNARKGRLRVTGSASALGIVPGQNANSVVVTTAGRPSQPFVF